MPYDENELTGFEEHERDMYQPGSDYVRCPYHGEVISNGMFDGVCGGCEAAMEPEPETLTPKDLEAMAERELARLPKAIDKCLDWSHHEIPF